LFYGTLARLLLALLAQKIFHNFETDHVG